MAYTAFTRKKKIAPVGVKSSMAPPQAEDGEDDDSNKA
jgi:hypothetical protein